MAQDGMRNCDVHAMCALIRERVHRGRFWLTDGQTTDWYVNGRALLLLPEFSKFAGRQMADLLHDDVRCIGGPVTAAIPVVAAMIHQAPVPRCGFCIRPEPIRLSLRFSARKWTSESIFERLN